MPNTKARVLLIYPGRSVKFPRLPMSCLVLAAYLRQKGLQVEILDTRLDGHKAKKWSEYLCIGISSMSGVQLRFAIEIAKAIKKESPLVPLVWGGAHVSFYPNESAQSPFVDYVVRGEGEEAFSDLIEKVILTKTQSQIAGVTFYNGDKLFSGPVRKHLDLDTLPFPAYDLLDIPRYADSLEGFSYESSRGCPHRCNFCYNDFFHSSDWRVKSPEKVALELGRIKKEIGINKIYFIDDNFMVSLSRVKEICLQINCLGLQWASTCRADYLAKYSRRDLLFLKEKGCLYLQYGAESGSLQQLEYLKKDITPEDILASVRNCVEAGIMPVVSFMIGFPQETEKERIQTIDLYDRIMELADTVEVNGIFIYTPYPATILYNEAVRLGFRERKQLEDWIDWRFSDTKAITWLDKRQLLRLEAIESISIFKWYLHRLNFYSGDYRKRMLGPARYILCYLLIPIMNISARLRWKYRFFSFALEWRLWRWAVTQFFPR
jgi:anaerobic magnesium-protoporphyrin IX monomethyl ester cyclase